MDQRHLLRTVQLIGFFTVIPIAMFYRIRSQVGGGTLDRRKEGWFILFTMRPIAMAGLVGLICYLVNPSTMAWSSVSLPLWLRWSGAGIGAAAGALIIWAFHNLGKNLTDTVVTREKHTLVTSGPYRWVRHPFYVAVLLAVLGNALMAANWFLFLTGALVFVLMTIRMRKEEELLVARFGDAYRDYMKRTGRFWPRMGG